MADLLYFANLQFGDHFIKVQGADQLLTPPVRRVGLFQQTAGISADSRNMLHARQVFISLTRATPVDLDRAIADIRSWQGKQGNMELRQDSNVLMRCEDWWLEQASVPNLRDGYGGRFVPSWPLFFVGETAPDYS